MYRDKSDKEVIACYGWKIDWQSDVFAPVDCGNRLGQAAENHRLFAAGRDDRLMVIPKGIPKDELPLEALELGLIAVGRRVVKLASGSLQKWVRITPDDAAN